MKGVVPAAGKGTRLRPLTDDRPKGLVAVAGRPILTHVFETLLDAGMDELIVVVGHRRERIVDHYGDEFRSVPVTYVHQREQRGLGDAVSLAEPYVDGPFVVLNGDNVFIEGIAPVTERFEATDADAVLPVETVDRETARTTGVVDVDDSGRVTGIVEKPDDPPSRLVTTGCYALPPSIFRALESVEPSEQGEYELSEAVGRLAADSFVETVRVPGPRVNVNTPADVERASRLLEERAASR